jgi:hypothetical protein
VQGDLALLREILFLKIYTRKTDKKRKKEIFVLYDKTDIGNFLFLSLFPVVVV